VTIARLQYRLKDIESVDDVLEVHSGMNASDKQLSSGVEKRIWIYGAGQLGRSLCKIARTNGVEVVGFIDRNPALAGTTISGLPVYEAISPPNGFVVVAMYNLGTNLARIREWTYGKSMSYIDFLMRIGGAALPFWCLQAPTTNLTAEDFQQIRDVEGRLSPDDRKEFARQLATRFLIGVEDPFPATCSPEHEYLAGAQSRFKAREKLLDIGAFDGDTAERFLDASKDVNSEVVAVEPDSLNYQRLIHRFAENPRVRTIHAIVGEAEGFGLFHSSGTVESREIYTGGVRVSRISVDQIILAEQEVTRIKVDVEGAEQSVLSGAKHTIAASEASWAISSYHKPQDLWRLPAFFASGNYSVEVHSHAQRPWDTVLYFNPV